MFLLYFLCMFSFICKYVCVDIILWFVVFSVKCTHFYSIFRKFDFKYAIGNMGQ